jgi:hypothetical protein
MRRTITLFMWGYQSHFRWTIEYRARRVFELLGAETEPKVLLVGVRRSGLPDGHPICVEPEDDEWSLEFFDGLLERIPPAIAAHPLQNMFYGDEPSNRDKPERIRREVIGDEVRRSLDKEGRKLGRRTFGSPAYPVGDYDVVCALQLPETVFRRFPSFEADWQGENYEASLVHSCINTILEEARRGLALPEPGRTVSEEAIRSPDEIIRRAAASFMRTQFIPGRFCTCDLFDVINRVSQLRYEGHTGIGRLELAAADDPNISYVLRLARPANLTETRWARKLLQMARADAALICEYGTIVGLGRVSDVSAEPFSIEFLDHHLWELRRGAQVLFRCSFGEVRLPQEPIGQDRFVENMRRVFGTIQNPAIRRFRIVLDLLAQLRHGSSLVIAADAKSEAKRLARQGTVIEPTPLTKELIESASAIDGTILANEQGVCHAIGVILDGQASDESVPSRGARYNSAVRYVTDAPVPRMAFVISEDRTVDVIPLLRPAIERSRIEAAVTEIEKATLETYHKCRAFLDEYRFYLNAEQCEVVNKALDRIESEPSEVGQIILHTNRFAPHPAFNDSYLTKPAKGAR